MKVLALRGMGTEKATVRLEEKPKPSPKRGEVLLKVIASPINPSDRMFVRGMYGIVPVEGNTAGFEGAGVVVESNAGIYGKFLMGKRVSAAVQGADGFWAEYVCVPAARCMPLGVKVSDDMAACALVNPLAAWALFEPVRAGEEPALLQTAGYSQVGRMLVRLGKKYQKRVVSIVHRPGLVEPLKKEGATDVLDSSTPDFEEKLRETCKRYDIHYAVDAVGGSLVATLGRAMQKRNSVHVYGALSEKNAESDPVALIFRESVVKGFWLNQWLAKQGMLDMLRIRKRLEDLLPNELRSDIAHRLSLSEAAPRYDELAANTSSGKVLLVPGRN